MVQSSPGHCIRQASWRPCSEGSPSAVDEGVNTDGEEFVLDSHSSAASFLPAEIIHRILEDLKYVLTTPGEEWWNQPYHSSAALVCKHWANVWLREERRVKLDGRKRVMALRSLVAAPSSYLKHSIADFATIEYDMDCKNSDGDTNSPWLHLIPGTRTLLPRCCSSPTDIVEIVGPLRPDGGHELKTMRSIHAYLPRQIPSMFSSTVRVLELQNIQFRQFSDLAHTVGELPSLQVFKGVTLTWVESESDAVPLRSSRRALRGECSKSPSPRIQLINCTRNLEALSLVDACHYRCVHMRRTLEALVPDNKSVAIRAQAKHERLCGSFDESDDTIRILYHVDISPYDFCQLRILHTWPLSPSTESSTPLRVRINIRLKPSASADGMHRALTLTGIDWHAFDSAVAEYTQVQRRDVVVGKYNHEMSRYRDASWVPMEPEDMRAVSESLPRSSEAGKVSFGRPGSGMQGESQWELKGNSRRRRGEMEGERTDRSEDGRQK